MSEQSTTAPRKRYTVTPPAFGTLAQQACAWLRAHPDEELTVEDMEIKFGREAIDGDRYRLDSACRLGLLEREQLPTRGRPWVYRAGAGVIDQ
jgi:hypothetical protein